MFKVKILVLFVTTVVGVSGCSVLLDNSKVIPWQTDAELSGDYKNAIDFLQEMLEKTKNPAIRNAVYLMLGDNLEETGRPQEVINLLKQGLDENLKNSD